MCVVEGMRHSTAVWDVRAEYIGERAVDCGNSCNAKLNGGMTNGCKCGKGKNCISVRCVGMK